MGDYIRFLDVITNHGTFRDKLTGVGAVVKGTFWPFIKNFVIHVLFCMEVCRYFFPSSLGLSKIDGPQIFGPPPCASEYLHTLGCFKLTIMDHTIAKVSSILQTDYLSKFKYSEKAKKFAKSPPYFCPM